MTTENTQDAGALDLGSLVANAKIGVQRNPQLPPGKHIVTILSTQKPGMATAFVADIRGEDGGTYSYYKPLDGQNAKAIAARRGEVLAFVCAAAGYRNMQEFEVDFDAKNRGILITKCLGTGPGPLQGRKLQITVTDSGQRTKPKTDPMTGLEGPTYPIYRYAFAPVAATE
jgi:hypothetical protein